MSQDPTGKEHITPVAIDTISVTERAQFRKCRRRWFLADVHRLESPVEAMYLKFGTAMHAALAYYHEVKKSLAGTLLVFHQEWEAVAEKEQLALGYLWTYAEPEWEAHRELGEAMLTGYVEADRGAGPLSDFPDMGKTIEVEHRYTVTIPRTAGKGKLTGKLDWVSEPSEGTRRGTDHKNLASTHSSAQLDIDDQLTGYAWLFYEATGTMLDDVAYNVLLKKHPITPSGKPTTSKLFVRDITYRSREQLAEFEKYLPVEFRDMKRVAAHPEQAYPNPTVFNCGGCPVRSICVAMMGREDVEEIIRSGYTIGDPRE